MMRLESSSVSRTLPWDLVEEILVRVPTTSLQRLRSTCKQWNALFSDQRFIKKHFDKAAKQVMVLMSSDKRFSSVNVNLRGLHDNMDPSIEVKGELCVTDPHYDSVKVVLEVFHCDGLLLCKTDNNRLMVWNPCTGQTKWIQSRCVYTGYDITDIYALGYDINKSCHNYKILRFLDFITFELEIYESNSNTWRVLHNRDTPDFKLHLRSVFLKGSAYWIASDKEAAGEFLNYFLISFDFTRERFGPRVCLPPHVYGYSDFIVLSSVKEERLSILFRNTYTYTMEIWMTNNITETKAMSWSIFLKIDLIDHDDLWFDLSYIIDEENKVVVMCCDEIHDKEINDIVYIIGEDEWRKVDFAEKFKWLRILSYVPSLVQF